MGKQIFITGAFSALAALAAAGWMRQPSPQTLQPFASPASYQDPLYATPAGYGAGPVAANPALYSPGYRYTTPAPVYDQPARVIAPRRVAAQRVSYSPAPLRTVRSGRPFSHSVAIVAGGAGAGAAIGALAGGGKGAGIGAISGGLAGLVYDRLTHNKSGF